MDIELTDKQLKFIDAYLNSKSITETCKKLKISRNTAYLNYLNDPVIKAEINKRRNELINDTTLFLQDKLIECSKVLMDIIQDKETPATTKIQAINSIFNNCNKLTETNDIITKLAEIEQRLAEQEDKANEFN
jgi:phage terminase small subunit